MDIEASVVERLQKLRQWQLEQQERLLKQQQIQRDMLTQKQDCMYKALELSIQELDLNEDTLNINNSNEIENNEINNKDLITLHNKSQIKESCMQMINDNISCISQNNNFENMILQQKSPTINFNDDIINIENHIKRQSKDEINSIISSEKEKQIEQFFIDGIAPLPPDKTVINHISIDDIPIFSPKKDFHTLLEEKLKDNNEIEPLIKSNTNSGNKIKKPFLRKGEGLTRFKLNQKSQLSTLKIRSRSASFNNKTQSGFKYSKNENKSNKITQDSKNAQLSKNIHCTNLAQKQLSLKNIPLPKKKIHSKSESNISSSHLKDYINEMKNTIELNSSDFHSGTHKELEEVRIFELLEEKAENSSFCSTSSTVTAFLQQSTPFKVKNAEYKTENNMKKTKQIIPINKVSKKQLDLKSSNQIFKCITSNKDMDDITHSDFISFENQKANHDNIYENIQHIDENNTMKTNEDGHILRNEIQSTYNEQNFCNVPVVEKNNEINDSLHVRFSEHNEYKTIGLTDTSSTSTESLATKCFFDDKLWSDSSILETESITETIPIAFNMSQPSITMKSKMQELNYKAQNCEDIKQDNNSICETNINQYVYHKDDLEISDTEDQTSNDETSNSYKNSQNNSKSQKNDNYNIKTLKYMKRYDNKEIDEYVNNCDNEKVTEYQENVEDLQETNGTIFKSELLKNRLLELEQEISIFRKENTALSMQRKKLHEDYKNLCKEYAQKEKNFEQNKKQVEERLQEEKKKLARQKAALENRMRDSQEKAQQSKLERQEIQNLKQEIIKLTEEMQIKESRWNAAESRYKCQMRILKRENSKLKQETERLQNLKKNDRNKGKFGTSANTRVIHQINKQLDMQFKESQKINDVLSQSDQKLVIKTITNDQNIEKGKEHNYNHNKNIINKSESQTITDAAKKRNLYENLIKEATSDLIEIQEQFNIPENLNKSESELSNKFKKLSNKTSKKSYEECDIFFNHNNQIEINEDNQIKNIQLHMQNDHTSLIPPMKTYNENYEKSLASLDKSNTCITTTSSNKTKQDTKQDVTQIEYFDGSIEYRFPNGNIKKIFPDQGVTKLIYYNGDMRETNKDGKIKYFYASTCTWHTTMPDGLEILEFSDGQIERRSQNGTVEVSFPDGSVRILESDGIEKWTLPDGTLIQILTNGEKILTLPNGQREIHTNTHKRREYPDGTVKLIYLDGTQETRYSNGRIRLKDKDGNLLMDSCQ